MRSEKLLGVSIHFSLIPKLRPHRRVIGRFLAFAHFNIDSGCAASFRQCIARQNRVDAKAAIFFKCAHLIIPPAVKFAFLVMDSKRIAQPDFA